MSSLPLASTALLVIDVQKAFDEIEANGIPRNNPQAIAHIAELLDAFRGKGAPVIHVRHASLEPDSRLRPDRPGYAVKEEARERAGEPVIVKHVNSAFIGTDLEARLRAAGMATLVIVGATTNHCVETTARMGANLGYEVLFAIDATHTFDHAGPDGAVLPADLLAQVTAANLHGEFATVVKTAELLEAS
jgi:nicotinamidase-related amidase